MRHALIEGDNLHTLAALTGRAAPADALTEHALLGDSRGAVDLIYIDPPYNTGNTNAYRYGDRRRERTDVWRHSQWCAFMLPRIELAHELLARDGVLLVSIDDHELATLRLLLDRVFGAANFIACIVWDGGRKNDSRHVSVGHEYVLAYAREKKQLPRWRERKSGLDELYAEVEHLRAEHGEDYASASAALKAWYKSLPAGHEAKAHAHYRGVDADGAYSADDISWPGGGGPTYEVLHPNGRSARIPSRGWGCSVETMQEWLAAGRVLFGADETKVPAYKRYLHETEHVVPGSIIVRDRSAGTRRLRALLPGVAFPHPKDPEVLKRLFRLALTGKNDALVLDFFAGSGSTGQAVLEMNAEDQTAHRFVLATSNENGICRDVCHERLRRLMSGERPDRGPALGGELMYCRAAPAV